MVMLLAAGVNQNRVRHAPGCGPGYRCATLLLYAVSLQNNNYPPGEALCGYLRTVLFSCNDERNIFFNYALCW